METWKLLIILLLAAVAAGSIGGVLIGKILVKRARSGHKPLLSKKERIAYLLCILIGTASILFGVFHQFPDTGSQIYEDMPPIGEDMPGGEMDGAGIDFNDSIAVAR